MCVLYMYSTVISPFRGNPNEIREHVTGWHIYMYTYQL